MAEKTVRIYFPDPDQESRTSLCGVKAELDEKLGRRYADVNAEVWERIKTTLPGYGPLPEPEPEPEPEPNEKTE